jgi:endonuclease/exonuclease/phosphatase (EEP) superfamily protein YafD
MESCCTITIDLTPSPRTWMVAFMQIERLGGGTKRGLALRLLAAFVVMGTLLPLIREPHWWIRVFDFPRVQLALLATLVLGAYLWHVRSNRGALRRPCDVVLIMLLIVALGYQTWQIWPYTRLHPVQSIDAEEQEAGHSFRLIVSNVLMDSRDAGRWLGEMRSAEPDVVLMLEPDAWWIEQVQPLRRELPFAVEHPLDNTFGIALYSRFPLRDVSVRNVVEDDIPSIWGTFELPAGDRVRFAFLHPRPPQVAQDTDERDAELVLVAREVDGHEGPLIVAGDFNDVAWSYTTKLFQNLTGLLDPRIGRGFYSTFHARYPPLRWPLDHAFHSKHLALVEIRRLDSGESDHFPILIELAVVPAAASKQEAPDAEAEDHDQAEEIIDEARD